MDVSTEKQRIHRISKGDEIVIYQMINTRLCPNAGDTKAVRADKAQRRVALEEFILGITPLVRGKPRNKGQRRLCYEDITTLLRKTGISYRELFEHISRDPDGNEVAVGWSTEIETKMCAYCDMLSPGQQEMVFALVCRMLAPQFLSYDMNSMAPITRLAQANALRAYCIGGQRNQMRVLGVERVYMRRCMPYSYNALELHLVPYVAKGCDVSPHWLLGLGETATVLAETAGAERIMDLFCFLPEDRKMIILSSVNAALTSGGK